MDLCAWQCFRAPPRAQITGERAPAIKMVGLRYLTGADIKKLRSRAACVEFRSAASKQQAIQCNIMGVNHFIDVGGLLPEVKAMLWCNAHVVASFDRNPTGFWSNAGLAGDGLVLEPVISSSLSSVPSTMPANGLV
jgi:hypothetical protein